MTVGLFSWDTFESRQCEFKWGWIYGPDNQNNPDWSAHRNNVGMQMIEHGQELDTVKTTYILQILSLVISSKLRLISLQHSINLAIILECYDVDGLSFAEVKPNLYDYIGTFGPEIVPITKASPTYATRLTFTTLRLADRGRYNDVGT